MPKIGSGTRGGAGMAVMVGRTSNGIMVTGSNMGVSDEMPTYNDNLVVSSAREHYEAALSSPNVQSHSAVGGRGGSGGMKYPTSLPVHDIFTCTFIPSKLSHACLYMPAPV